LAKPLDKLIHCCSLTATDTTAAELRLIVLSPRAGRNAQSLDIPVAASLPVRLSGVVDQL
jgi:hypothetical protein